MRCCSPDNPITRLLGLPIIGLEKNLQRELGVYTIDRVEQCVEKAMPTILAIDDRLIAETQKLGRHRTKKDAVNAALHEYVNRRKQQILSLFGTVDYDQPYDYKRERRKRA